MKNTFIKYSRDIVLVLVATFVYLVSRLVNLSIIPIFTDEAIYLRWSQIMANDASLRYLPLIDGKPPLFMWLTSFAMKLLSQVDPLIVGRLISVGSGLFGAVGVYFASYQLFRNKSISWLATFAYICCPFIFFYNRFGLADSLLASLSVWALGLTVLLVKSLRLDVALILGGIIGFGLLTKSPALFLLVYLPLSLILFDFKKKGFFKRGFTLASLFLVVIIVSQSIYSILRLFPLSNMISQKNFEFSLTLKQFFSDPLQLVTGNLTTLINWEVIYLTLPIAILILIGLASNLKRDLRQKALIASYFLVYFVYLVFFNKIIYARYLLLFTPVILILAGYGCHFLLIKIKSLKLKYLLLSAIFVFPVVVCLQLIVNPVSAIIPKSDKDQYLNSWPAGFGVYEVRQFFHKQSLENPKVTVGVEGTFGLMPYAFEIYQKDYPNVSIKPYWPLRDKIPQDIAEAAKDQPTFFIIYQRQTTPEKWNLELISSYRQGNGSDHFRLYKVLADK